MTHAKSAFVGVMVAALGSVSVARAAAPPRPAEGASTPECQRANREPGERLHDGFFARSDTGLALFRADVSGGTRRTGIRGIGQSAVISVGGTPARGLVLGGTVWTSRIDPVFVENGRTITPDDDSVKITLLRTGPFVDYYPDPARGFHAQSAVQLAIQIESDAKGNAIKPAAFGAALSVGAGYEWFVSSELSLGFLARMALGRVVRSPSSGDEQMLWLIPELGLSATYH